MATTPGDQPRHIIIGDLGKLAILAEKADHALDIGPCRRGLGMMLADLEPIATGRNVERQRFGAVALLAQKRPRLLPFCSFYLLGFPSALSARRAVNATTFDLEVEMPERRAGQFVDRHGWSLCDRRSMKSCKSDSANIRRGFVSPRSTLT